MKMQIAIIFSLFFNVHNGAPYSWSCPQHSTKTRLCARGLEELPYFRTDTSTCSWKGIRIPLTTIASQKWQLHSLNIKTSIPLSKINPEKCFSPPTKRKPIPTNLLHLKNCLYGEASTSRYWYLSIKEDLTKLNRHILPADKVSSSGTTVTISLELLHALLMIEYGVELEYFTSIKQSSKNSKSCSKLNQKVYKHSTSLVWIQSKMQTSQLTLIK